MIPWFHKIGSMVQWFHACMQRFRGSRGLTALQQPQAACAASQFFLGSRYFSYQTHGFFTTASFGTSIFRLQLLYLSVQRNGFTCRFQALKHRPLALDSDMRYTHVSLFVQYSRSQIQRSSGSEIVSPSIHIHAPGGFPQHSNNS